MKVSLSLLFGLSLSVAGCALLEKPEIVEPRLFAPRIDTTSAPASASASTGSPSAPLLQIGDVTAASYLKVRMVYRSSRVELGTYDDRQWTERPDKYLERSLDHALFGKGLAAQAVGGAAPTLDAELVAFEEVRSGMSRRGRVGIHFTLHDDVRVLLDDTVTEEKPARSNRPEDVVDAISAALDAATAEISSRVDKRLAQLPARDAAH